MKIGKTKCPLIAQVRGDVSPLKNITLINHWNLIKYTKKSKLFLYFFSLSRIIVLIIEYW